MRVIEIVYNWPAETFIQRHIQAMQTSQFPLHVIARHSPASLHESASLGGKNEKIDVEVMPNFNHFGWAGKLASLRFLTTKSIRKQRINALSKKTQLGYFERLRPDLMHFHDASLASSMRWIPLALGIPYTLSLRGSDVQVLTLQSAAQRNAIISAIEGAAKVHAVCHALGRTAAQLLGRDLDSSVIFTTVPIPSTLPAWKGVPTDEQIHFLSSGRLMWRKGFPDLLIALRHLRDRDMDARLTLIGVGPELDHMLFLRKMLDLESAVDLPGKLTYEQIRNLFRGAHAYIQSSVAEGLSNSLAEAMANGLPVFATDVGGTGEVIEDGVSGFLLPPFAPQDWAETLMLVQNVTLMEKVRVVSYDKARRLFSAKQHAESFKTFFEKTFH